MKSYEDMTEEEFRQAIDGIAMYSGSEEQRTLDGEWLESELSDCVYSDCADVLNDWLGRNEGKLINDKDLIKINYLVETVCDNVDIIEIYNREYDKHRSDKDKLFGIAYFDKWCKSYVKSLLNKNLVY